MHMSHVFSRHTFGLEQLGIHLGNRLEQLGIHLGIQSTGAKLLRGGRPMYRLAKICATQPLSLYINL